MPDSPVLNRTVAVTLPEMPPYRLSKFGAPAASSKRKVPDNVPCWVPGNMSRQARLSFVVASIISADTSIVPSVACATLVPAKYMPMVVAFNIATVMGF